MASEAGSIVPTGESDPGMRILPISQGFSVMVDAQDYTRVSKWKWKVLKAKSGKVYACRTTRSRGAKDKTILMHRFLTDAPDDMVVDHRNGNGLDNRRTNLRVCTQGQNMANMESCRGSSRFKGVYWNKEKALWQAQIRDDPSQDGRQRVGFLGRYESEGDAALAYDRAARARFGEFARTNFADDDGREIRRADKPRRPQSGEDNPSCKLSRLEASEIKRRALLGEKQRAIAEEFGVSTKLVSAIKTGVAWRGLL